MRDRSWRRAQRERAIARTRRWMKDHGWFADPFTRWKEDVAEVHVRKNAATPHPCSSYCCGNPRKWFGDETLQEQRAGVGEKEQREHHECSNENDLND